MVYHLININENVVFTTDDPESNYENALKNGSLCLRVATEVTGTTVEQYFYNSGDPSWQPVPMLNLP